MCILYRRKKGKKKLHTSILNFINIVYHIEFIYFSVFIIHLSVYNFFLYSLQIHSISCAFSVFSFLFFFAEVGKLLWDKVEVCSLFKAFHVPIAFHKVHYIGEEGARGRGRGRSGTHPGSSEKRAGQGEGEWGGGDNYFGLKISFLKFFPIAPIWFFINNDFKVKHWKVNPLKTTKVIILDACCFVGFFFKVGPLGRREGEEEGHERRREEGLLGRPCTVAVRGYIVVLELSQRPRTSTWQSYLSDSTGQRSVFNLCTSSAPPPLAVTLVTKAVW